MEAREQGRMQIDCPHLTLPRWTGAIVLSAVWPHPSHCFRSFGVTQAACGPQYGVPTRHLRAVLAVADRGHGCMAEEGQADSDRSGLQQHWSTNFAACQSCDSGRRPPLHV